MNEASTRTQLFGVLLAAGEVTAPQLIALAAPLGLTATNVKSHLSRLVAEGVVRRRGARRLAVYALTAKQQPVVEAINLRLADPPADVWDGAWLMLAVRPARARAVREALRAQLWFDGFRLWGREEVWLRPAWPAAWAMGRVQAYVASGAGLSVRGALAGAANVAAMRAMYEIEQLDREAAALAATADKQTTRFRTEAQAFAVRLTLAGRIVDVIARDPRLPPALTEGLSGLAGLRAAYRVLMQATDAPARSFVERVKRS